MRRAPDNIWDFLSPIVEGMNYKFVGASLGQGETGLTLRVFIDQAPGAQKTVQKAGQENGKAEQEDTIAVELEDGMAQVPVMDQSGILVEDCAAVSRQVGAALDVEDLIAGEYCLEVSSPGVDRPLFSVDDYKEQVGNTIKLRLEVASVTGRRNYKGVVVSVDNDQLVIEVDGEHHELAIKEVEFANLVTKFR